MNFTDKILKKRTPAGKQEVLVDRECVLSVSYQISPISLTKKLKTVLSGKEGKMNKRRLKVTYRRYLGPALYDLIHAERTRPVLPVTSGQIAKLAKEEV